MVWSCQAAMMEKKQSYNLVKITNGKHYIFGDALNYYLIESKMSFYNILMGQYTFKIPGAEPIKIKPVLTRVANSIGLDSYLIGNKFHPEKVFDFDLYRSTWKKFYDTLIKYCSNSDEWPVLFSISLTQFLDLIYLFLGINGYAELANNAFENAVYVSKISQI